MNPLPHAYLTNGRSIVIAVDRPDDVSGPLEDVALADGILRVRFAGSPQHHAARIAPAIEQAIRAHGAALVVAFSASGPESELPLQVSGGVDRLETPQA